MEESLQQITLQILLESSPQTHTESPSQRISLDYGSTGIHGPRTLCFFMPQPNEKKKQQQKLHSFGIAKHGAEPETKSQTSGFVARSGAQLEFNTAG